MNKEELQALMNKKSTGIACLLTLFFGPLGLLYSSITGGIIMGIIYILLVIIAFIPVVGLVAIPAALIGQIICVIWSIVATNGHNRKLLAKIDTDNTVSV